MEYLKRNSFILKSAIFATGFAGIVAEYTLSTLATYFIGNSIFQWTMIVSLMLFCMGLGSRLKVMKTVFYCVEDFITGNIPSADRN